MSGSQGAGSDTTTATTVRYTDDIPDGKNVIILGGPIMLNGETQDVEIRVIFPSGKLTYALEALAELGDPVTIRAIAGSLLAEIDAALLPEEVVPDGDHD